MFFLLFSFSKLIKLLCNPSLTHELLQVDFNLPQRFDITYVDSNQERKRPIMIHRAVLGSLERFFGVLIENYAGDFPIWLSPIQARVLPVTDAQVINTCLTNSCFSIYIEPCLVFITLARDLLLTLY